MSDDDQKNRDQIVEQIVPMLLEIDPNVSIAILLQTTINLMYLYFDLLPNEHEETVYASLHRLEEHINTEILHIKDVFKK